MSEATRSKLVKMLCFRIIDWIFIILFVGIVLSENPTNIDLKVSTQYIQFEINSDFASVASGGN